MDRLYDLTNSIEAEERIRPLVRAIAALGTAPDHFQHSAAQIAKARWPTDRDTIETIQRAAVVPTSTTTAGLANNLVADVSNVLGPLSASGRIFSRAFQQSFAGYTSVSVPTIIASPATFAFIAQGAPVPIKQFSVAGPTLDPKKIGGGFALTRDLMEGSNAEVLIRAELAACTSLAVDTLLLDAVAADTLRPAGLRNGINAITATAIGTPVLTATDAMFKDLSNLAAAVAPVAGSLDNIVFIASPGEAVKIAMRTDNSFKFDVFASSGLAAGIVVALAVNALAVAAGEQTFSVSDATAVHMEDTAPAQIGSTGPVVAAPTRSLWQTATVATKLIFDLNWALRVPATAAPPPANAVAWTQTVIW